MVQIAEFESRYAYIPIEEINAPFIKNAGVKLMVKREDLIHPEISGNKWRKLKYNLKEARKQGISKLLTFGGAYSNHIYATAAASKFFGFEAVGIIRGERPQVLNPTLQYAEACGMQLHFVSRSDYRDKKALLSKLPIDQESSYILPEGGTNNLALKGCAEIIQSYNDNSKIDYWCAACGTGGTLAGMITALSPEQKAIGFSALKGDFLTKEVKRLLLDYNGKEYQNWSINTDYHFRGYAKFNAKLIEFINEFKHKYQIQLDPVYTGKMFFGIFQLINDGFFPKGTTIMAIHTGGQQGIRGFNQRFGDLLK